MHLLANRPQVSLPVVRRFVGRVEEAALGVKVLKGVRPDQQLVKVVNDQLIELMGGQQEGLVEVKAGQTQVGVQGPNVHSTCTMPPHQQPMMPGGGQDWPAGIGAGLGWCTQCRHSQERATITPP
jgi:hypothetical protein